ncbi:MAG: Bifunctional protein FolD protein [Chlamydiia bacterium]|nr:Bifunctional protein FolD protein [Chlamydiia bacterium]MCH9615792.1 Bifunctional protein FolD protein [Chlamydiia bacterium]MCH9628805.1 Bifunctional protein FolD protein [Chlamydiia bacterium]
MILDGKALSQVLLNDIKETVKTLRTPPTLTCIIIGDDPASHAYVKMKQKRSKEVGIESTVIHLPKTTTHDELKEKIRTIKGPLLVQQPLPFEARDIVPPSQDVDGFHTLNLGKLAYGDQSGPIACTPLGILKLLEHYKIALSGKHVVIIGRSNIVGKPLALLLMQKPHNATVTVANSQTENLKTLTQSADILISATGSPRSITADHIKRGAIVIDVGITRDDDRLIGDVDFENVQDIASAITPVPGGVGPMTIAMLLQNTLLLS